MPETGTEPGQSPTSSVRRWMVYATFVGLAAVMGGVVALALVFSRNPVNHGPKLMGGPNAAHEYKAATQPSGTNGPVAATFRAEPEALSPQEVFEKASPAVVRIVVHDKDFKASASGSGFLISADGLVVANFHVIDGAQFATVRLSNNATLFVEGIAATDKANDLALLKVHGTDLPALTLRTGVAPTVGEKVYAIGNPEGLTNRLSAGLVSGLHAAETAPLSSPAVIQTTAAISPGSSGGPLLSADGRVIGVTTAFLRDSHQVNFAVPVERAVQLVKNRGPLATLASAGGKALDRDETAELDKVWSALDRKDWREALTLLSQLRAKVGGSSWYWWALGFVHDAQANYEVAVDAYRECLRLRPEFAEAYCGMGSVYLEQGKQAEALAAFKAALAVKPDYAEAYYRMGYVYFNQSRYAEAITAFKSALAMKPDYAEAYYRMGAAYNNQGRYTEAIAAYQAALAVKPGYAAAYLLLGIACEMQGKKAQAAAAYRKAMQLDPGGATGRDAKGHLDKVNR